MPLRDAEVVKAFGDPGPYIMADGTVSPIWETRILTVIQLPATLPLSWAPPRQVTHVRCHARIAPFLEAAFQEVFTADQWQLLEDFGGCYAWRTIRRDPHHLSRHCWGIAVDLNVKKNPQGSPPSMPAAVVGAFKAQGFEWGGLWAEPRTDGMHFEFVDVSRLRSPV
jgi:hypothetical protein